MKGRNEISLFKRRDIGNRELRPKHLTHNSRFCHKSGTLTQEWKKVECNISGEANILIPPAGKDREGRGREEVGRGTQRIHFNNILKVNIFWPPGQRTRGCC